MELLPHSASRSRAPHRSPSPLPTGQRLYGVSMRRDGAESALISMEAVGLRGSMGSYGDLWGAYGVLWVPMGPPHNSSPLRTALEDSRTQRCAG